MAFSFMPVFYKPQSDLDIFGTNISEDLRAMHQEEESRKISTLPCAFLCNIHGFPCLSASVPLLSLSVFSEILWAIKTVYV